MARFGDPRDPKVDSVSLPGKSRGNPLDLTVFRPRPSSELSQRHLILRREIV
jgi:hypothetical protein